MVKKNNSGQALLIVLLSMAVILTVVLSIFARSVTDVSISTKDEDSLRAFSAAEAGVEKALIVGSSIDSTELGDASYSASVASFAEGKQSFIYPTSLFSGESATIWFVAHDDNGDFVCSVAKPCFKSNTLKVCWGKQGIDPAIEVSVFYTPTPGDYSTAKVARIAIDPNSTRRLENKFVADGDGTCTIGDVTYPFFRWLNFSNMGISNATTENVLQFATIRMLYNTDSSSPLAVSGSAGSLFPSQGLEIESSGASGDANRKINVFKFFSESADVFQFGAFSFGSIVK